MSDERIATIAAQQGVRPEDVSRTAGEIAVLFVDMTLDEALDAIEGAEFHLTAARFKETS